LNIRLIACLGRRSSIRDFAMPFTNPDSDFLAAMAGRLGPRGFTTDPADMEPWLTDWRGKVHGKAAALLSPASTAEVAFIVQRAAAARVPLVPQGGNTSTVGGATPSSQGNALLLSLRRMRSSPRRARC
jgi:FAD/FMN-containing dehydrogenase